MATWQRTHTCGQLRAADVDTEVTLNGWVENRRHHGALFFVDLRDRHGVTQVTFDTERGGASADLFALARELGAEDVVSVRGKVVRREAPNKNRATGEIEVQAHALDVLSRAEPPPFEVLDVPEANEELRMKYRYLDIRRRPLARALELRARFLTAVRNYFAQHAFIEVETPILTKSTPEGARDYLVPSRVHPGRFYALPQSPQIFKQLLMVAGIDRYFQIARCFRDEDLRADRQPEFTQIDLEMSFVEEENVLEMVEGMLIHAFRAGFGIELPHPFPRFDYDEAMSTYGNDKPDLRFDMKLVDVGELVRHSDFKVFADTMANGGSVRGLCAKAAGERFSRKDIDALTAFVGEYGARGLAWAKVTAEGLQGSIAKFFGGDAGAALCRAMDAAPGDILFFVADKKKVVLKALGELRLRLGSILGLRDPEVFRFAWVTNFPMFEWSDERNKWEFAHNPFSAPVDWSVTDFTQDTEKHKSRAYDIVMNGWELGSGSIRIHRPELQKQVFAILGISEDQQRANFGFMLDAYRYGAPPHGGIALGVDRLVTLALGLDSIRDAIAFPKTASATDLMADAPSPVGQAQLEELGIRLVPPPS
ncbi:MAG: aspartate--tRNA ligase [Planctomycetota bacterium]